MMKKHLQAALKVFLAALILTSISEIMVIRADEAGTKASSAFEHMEAAPEIDGLIHKESADLSYARQFAIDIYEGGYKLLRIANGQNFLLVPEGKEAPEGISEDITVLFMPVSDIYLAATAAMDYFRQLGRIDAISLSSQKEDGWYIPEAREAMHDGRIKYAGKYSAPDYELLLSKGCNLAIENTMIYHTPKVLEQIENLGIPVIVEYSSYETHPLGRMEWLKFYAALTGEDAAADNYFKTLTEKLSSVLEEKPSGKRIAFFSINSNGAVTVRKSADYIAKSIELAGGSYVSFDESDEENALSTMTVQMESFYQTAKDSDILIYNSTIEGEINTISQLLGKSSLLADFGAVKEGRVWCIEKNFYQEALKLSELILDVNTILEDEGAEDEDLYFLHRLDSGG